jgi:lysylphosphatidylglycerol synthetase-like protein (DUF2156 family)
MLARALQQRLDAAYYLALAGLVAGAVVSLAKGLDYEEATLLTLMFLALLPGHRFFYRRSSLLQRVVLARLDRGHPYSSSCSTLAVNALRVTASSSTRATSGGRSRSTRMRRGRCARCSAASVALAAFASCCACCGRAART